MAEYLGVKVDIASNDRARHEFLEAAGEGRLTLQKCVECQKLRYPIMTACPFCNIMITDGVKLLEEKSVDVLDISELISNNI